MDWTDEGPHLQESREQRQGVSAVVWTVNLPVEQQVLLYESKFDRKVETANVHHESEIGRRRQLYDSMLIASGCDSEDA